MTLNTVSPINTPRFGAMLVGKDVAMKQNPDNVFRYSWGGTDYYVFLNENMADTRERAPTYEQPVPEARLYKKLREAVRRRKLSVERRMGCRPTQLHRTEPPLRRLEEFLADRFQSALRQRAGE